jgi:hypothetical protein
VAYGVRRTCKAGPNRSPSVECREQRAESRSHRDAETERTEMEPLTSPVVRAWWVIHHTAHAPCRRHLQSYPPHLQRRARRCSHRSLALMLAFTLRSRSVYNLRTDPRHPSLTLVNSYGKLRDPRSTPVKVDVLVQCGTHSLTHSFTHSLIHSFTMPAMPHSSTSRFHKSGGGGGMYRPKGALAALGYDYYCYCYSTRTQSSPV